MRFIFAVLMALGISCPVLADDSTKEQDIRKLFNITNTAVLNYEETKKIAELQRRANPQIPPAFWTELFNELKPEGFIDRMVPIYNKHFSHEEIKAWIVFFESPFGQAILKKEPVALQESTAACQAYVQEVGGPILRRLNK